MARKQRLQHNQVGVYVVAVVLAIGVGVARPGTDPGIERVINPVLAALPLALALPDGYVLALASSSSRPTSN